MKRVSLIVAALLLLAQPVAAKVDLVSLPGRDKVEITIYNSADLTLVRDNRTLTLKSGENRLQFSWADTLIDPTSLEMLPKTQADKIHVQELIYPPRVQNLGIWNIASELSGQAPMEISYLTSGLSWRAFYMGTLSPDEATMRLQGYVRVTNNSGEDYENAVTRVIVGKVHLLDKIAELARRQYPYGQPQPPMPPAPMLEAADDVEYAKLEMEKKSRMVAAAGRAPKEIKKEGLSEYFLYTIEGTETIRHGWSKRLPSFEAQNVPVKNLYKYDPQRYGPKVIRFLSFKNDKEHKMGETPIPGGSLKVYRTTDQSGRLSYEGQSSFQYIPVDEDVELNLGGAENVLVEKKNMDYRVDNIRFDSKGNISELDRIVRVKVELKNTRPLPVALEYTDRPGGSNFEITEPDQGFAPEKVDKETYRWTLDLAAGATKTFHYTIVNHQKW
jgi:hypothetical protein